MMMDKKQILNNYLNININNYKHIKLFKQRQNNN